MVYISFWFTVKKYWAKAYIIFWNTRDLIIASKWIGLEVNTDKTKYVIMPQD